MKTKTAIWISVGLVVGTGVGIFLYHNKKAKQAQKKVSNIAAAADRGGDAGAAPEKQS